MSLCIILGAGSHARETFWHAQSLKVGHYSRFVFVDDATDARALEIGGRIWPVEKEWQFEKYRQGSEALQFVLGVAEPRGKMKLVEKALAAGLTPLPTLIHQSAIIQDSNCKVGLGGLISPGCILTTNVAIGDYVTLNLSVTVSHDCRLEDFVNCAPRVSLAGNVHLESGVNLGIGTVIREKTRVAPFVVTGAQSCVVKHVETAGSLVVGVPAAPIRRRRTDD